MSDDIHRVMNLLIKKKFPDKVKKYFMVFNYYPKIWIRTVEKYDALQDEFYCFYCDQLLDITNDKLIIDHALQHIRENNLTAFI